MAIGEDSFQLVGTQVQTKVAMTLSNIAPFSVTVSDNTPTTPETVTSPSTYPNIQANFQNKFNREDIVYKVTKVYDLQHGVLTIPSRSTVLLEGGAFYNGTLKFDDVTINSDSNGSYAIFTDVAIEPTDEYRENRESVEAAVATLTQESKTKRGDTMATHVWWDCK